MLLALDVGNTNIVIGFLDESGIRNIARLETDRDKTAHEYAISLRQVIEFSGIAPEQVDGAILSSVVPPINGALVAAVRMITGIRPLVVGPGMKTGLNIAAAAHLARRAEKVHQHRHHRGHALRQRLRYGRHARRYDRAHGG